MSQNNGGPAFPSTLQHNGWLDKESGMSLRDYFAVHASDKDIQYYLGDGRSREQARYLYADAMLEARK